MTDRSAKTAERDYRLERAIPVTQISATLQEAEHSPFAIAAREDDTVDHGRRSAAQGPEPAEPFSVRSNHQPLTATPPPE